MTRIPSCFKIAVFIFILLFSFVSYSQLFKLDPEIGVTEKQGKIIPLELAFKDETGKDVTLKQLIRKPTLLVPVYFRCPSICTPLLNGVSDALDKIDYNPGKEYDILTISFDDRETPEIAQEKKNNYLKKFNRQLSPDGWRFLTGTKENIKLLMDSVGYKFKRSGEDYLHPAAIITLTKEGKISRYFYGLSFLPFDLKMGLIEASEGKTGPTINKVLLYCFSYDGEGRKYVFNILKVTGSLTLLLILFFVIFLVIYKPAFNSEKNNSVKGEGPNDRT